MRSHLSISRKVVRVYIVINVDTEVASSQVRITPPPEQPSINMESDQA